MFSFKAQTFRRSNPQYVIRVWQKIFDYKTQKSLGGNSDRLIAVLMKELNESKVAIYKLLDDMVHDGLLRTKPLPESPSHLSYSITISKINKSDQLLTYYLPDLSMTIQSKHDWYCFQCHAAGEVISCTKCYRVYHSGCIESVDQQHSSDFTCSLCLNKTESKLSRKEIRKLLDFASFQTRKQESWKTKFSNYGFAKEFFGSDLITHHYIDTDLLHRKIFDGRYLSADEFLYDIQTLVHDVCLLYGPFSSAADDCRFMARTLEKEVQEAKLCFDCYINSKVKRADWISKPCKPSHKLIWAMQTSSKSPYPSKSINDDDKYYWPAKILKETPNGFEVRFFGDSHDRRFVSRQQTLPFNKSWNEIPIKRGTLFEKSWSEAMKLQENEADGYYTHSSGDSDLPPSDREYTDETYLRSRRLKRRKSLGIGKSTVNISKKHNSSNDETRRLSASGSLNARNSSGSKSSSINTKHPIKSTSTGGNLSKKKSGCSSLLSDSSSDEETGVLPVDANASWASSDSSSSALSTKIGPSPQTASPVVRSTRNSTVMKNKTPTSNETTSKTATGLQNSTSRYNVPVLSSSPACSSDEESVTITPKETIDKKIPKKRITPVPKRKQNSIDVKDSMSAPKTKPPIVRKAIKREAETIPLKKAKLSPYTSSSSEATDPCSHVNFPPEVRPQILPFPPPRRAMYAAEIQTDPLPPVTPVIEYRVAPCNCNELFQKKLKEILENENANAQKLLQEQKSQMELEKHALIEKIVAGARQEHCDAMENMRRTLEEKTLEAINEAKRRQWCKNCLKEAIYHCCWNTSYCSITCQQDHWQKEHKRACRRKR